MKVLKGHGTGNDFVLVPDLDGQLDLTPSLVRALCDRHTGLGADGVLRVVRTAAEPEAATMSGHAEWFMDYRNADGTLAEMCGNGLRLFVRYLSACGLVEQDAAVATRGGIMRVRLSDDGNVNVGLGKPRILADRPVVTAAPSTILSGTTVLVPNPHVVVELTDEAVLVGLDLTTAPTVDPPRSAGQNVEFVVRVGPRHLRMRVFERGVGETLSCGTGIAAVVAALGEADGQTWRVDVPGGTCFVTWDQDGLDLSGPAVIVGEVELSEQWLAGLMSSTAVPR